MPFDDSAYRVINRGDSTYYRPSREAADRAAGECLKCGGRDCEGVIETKGEAGWTVVARFKHGHGIQDVTAGSVL